MILAGIDGCRAGWIAAIATPAAPLSPRLVIVPTLATLLEGPGAPNLIAIDMPIGLPDRVGEGGRGPERLLRPLLGPRKSSVFSVPARAAVEAADYRAACAAALASSQPPRQISQQAFHLFPKMRELDALLRADPGAQARFYETHPELVFRALAGAPLQHPKKTAAGLDERRAILIAAGLDAAVVTAKPPRGAGADDALDALAGLLTARAVAAGTVVSHPDPPARDPFGLPIAIWSPAFALRPSSQGAPAGRETVTQRTIAVSPPPEPPAMPTTPKTDAGRFFEDFALGETIVHATPRTVTAGDVSLYTALYGPRFAVQSSQAFAGAIGYETAPIDDLLVFHIVFGKTVPDISLNAVANLGYADGRFLKAVHAGDTLATVSEVIGLKQTSAGDTGIVYVRSTGTNQRGEPVLTYVRWVLVRKRVPGTPPHAEHVPQLPDAVGPEALGTACPPLDMTRYDLALAGSPHRWGDYAVGERIDHVDGMTVEEAEHQIATRLYQNTAKVHFDAHAARETRFGKRLIYGGHVISLARALSFNGLGNAFHIAAINGGRHVAPLFAGDTVYAWSEVIEAAPLPGRDDVGALRLRLVATKNRPCDGFPFRAEKGYDEGVILDFDYWALLPR